MIGIIIEVNDDNSGRPLMLKYLVSGMDKSSKYIIFVEGSTGTQVTRHEEYVTGAHRKQQMKTEYY